ncbi:MAG: DUF2184 domain-containing protein [Rhodospirillaceae bacterium]|nr:DUF2184 domain-containing protein [Rhodospirillaceae bacterium]
MANLFGRKGPDDYEHLRDLGKAQGERAVREELERRAAFFGLPIDWECLGRASRSGGDDALVTIATNNLQFAYMAQEEALYRGIRFEDFVPLKEDIPLGAESARLDVWDFSGEGGFLDEMGKNINTASLSVDSPTVPLRSGGMYTIYTREQMEGAAYAGIALSEGGMKASIRGSLTHMERVALTGVGWPGYRGVINQATTGTGAVSLTTSTLGTWTATSSAATPKQIRKQVQESLRRLIANSNEIIGTQLRGEVAILLPMSHFDLISEEPLMESNPVKSIWDWVMEKNACTGRGVGPVKAYSVSELAGAGGTENAPKDRMITMLKDNMICEMPVVLRPTTLTLEHDAYCFKYPVYYRFGPFWLKRPWGMDIVDGI